MQALQLTVPKPVESLARIKPPCPLLPRETITWVLVAAASFHAAYFSDATSFLVVIYLFGLVQLSRAASWRGAFYSGLSVGMLIAVGRLEFFWRIFSVAAIPLWLVYAVWIGLFVVVARFCLRPGSKKWGCMLVPFVWCGLEYFRSELYYLRFSWLSSGLAFGLNASSVPISVLGCFGIGLVLMGIALASALSWSVSKAKAVVVMVTGLALIYATQLVTQKPNDQSDRTLQLAGVQLEFPSEKEVVTWLNELTRQHPEAQLLLLSEYTFTKAIPDEVKEWCRDHRKYLLIGAVEELANHQFYDTAFVISPGGQVVFHQAKSVPIQFFNDGLPAPSQSVWESPWGKIGICICYDLSYTRVTDQLIRMGAEMLIVPTMDVTDWGKRQHELHSRVGPVRAAEYHVPVVRLASSGISQAIDSTGKVLCSAPCPGQGAMIAANLPFSDGARLPLDRWLAPVSTTVTVICLAVFGIRGWSRRKSISGS